MSDFPSVWTPSAAPEANPEPEEQRRNGYHYPPEKLGGNAKIQPRPGVPTSRTWRLDGATVIRLDALAARLNVYHSPLVDHLLQAILDQVERGEYEIRTRPAHNVIDNR